MTMLLTLFMPIAMADANDTTLEVSLYGMTLLPTGEWRSEAIALYIRMGKVSAD